MPNAERSSKQRPALRAVETILVPDAEHGQVLVLRDTRRCHELARLRASPAHPRGGSLHGHHIAEIARAASAELGVDVPEELVASLADELDRALFLEGPTYRAARAPGRDGLPRGDGAHGVTRGRRVRERPRELKRYLDDKCLAKRGAAVTPTPEKLMVALVAPHIDPWRGAVGYGHAYGAVARSLPPEVDTFVLFGTSHAPMREPFALCDKAFDTPLGALPADHDALAAHRKALHFDAYADQFNHKREHSLEFQVVFLKHLLGERSARIVPVLAGLGGIRRGVSDPAGDKRPRSFSRGSRRCRRASPAASSSWPGPTWRTSARASATPSLRKGRARSPRRDRPRSLARAARGRRGLLEPRRARPRLEARLRPRAHLLASPHGAGRPASRCSTMSRRSTRTTGPSSATPRSRSSPDQLTAIDIGAEPISSSPRQVAGVTQW